MKKITPQKIKNFYHLTRAALANFLYGFPSKRIKIIGVTGTNGKTTTCQMIAKIFEEAGHRVAMASTINFKLGDKEWVNATKYTTLSSFQVQKFIREAVDNKCEYLVLETSSHSLDQHRVFGVNYDVAVITNVTREHLDYHKTMEKYRKAKEILFKKAKIIVVNLNMEKTNDFLQYGSEKYGYAIEIEDAGPKAQKIDSEVRMIKATDVKLGIQNTKFKIQKVGFDLNLLGLFNVENALAAICAGLSQGVDLWVAKKALEKISFIPGRIEKVPNSRELDIIIDYAVTPDSLEKLYQLLGIMASAKKKLSKSDREPKIIAVFGSCGDRDRGKRPLMGEIVSNYADYIILTNEDPYNEDSWQIINEVAKGIRNKKEGENFWRIMDRREAIKKALQIAHPGDTVVITGKGAEETMAIGEKRIPWNDKRVIFEELKN